MALNDIADDARNERKRAVGFRKSKGNFPARDPISTKCLPRRHGNQSAFRLIAGLKARGCPHNKEIMPLKRSKSNIRGDMARSGNMGNGSVFFGRFFEFGLEFEVVMAAFAADDEFFEAGLEIFPFLSDDLCFVEIDAGVVFDGFGDGVEEFAEFADHSAGFGEDQFFEGFGGIDGGVGAEEAAGLVAEPSDDADVLGDFVEVFDAVHGVFGAALVGVIAAGGRFAPFVNEGGRDLQSRRHRLDAGLLDRISKDFM